MNWVERPFNAIALFTCTLSVRVFFFNDTATTEIYTLSLHDALPIYFVFPNFQNCSAFPPNVASCTSVACWLRRSEEHTSELQSRLHLVCRLLLEKKKIDDFLTLDFETIARQQYQNDPLGVVFAFSPV